MNPGHTLDRSWDSGFWRFPLQLLAKRRYWVIRKENRRWFAINHLPSRSMLAGCPWCKRVTIMRAGPGETECLHCGRGLLRYAEPWQQYIEYRDGCVHQLSAGGSTYRESRKCAGIGHGGIVRKWEKPWAPAYTMTVVGET